MSEPERSDIVICPGCGYGAERFTDYSRAGFPDGYYCYYCDENVNPTIARFKSAWGQVMRGETHPIETLWDDVDDD